MQSLVVRPRICLGLVAVRVALLLTGVPLLCPSWLAAALSAVVAGVAIRAAVLSALLAVVMSVLVLMGWLVAPFVVLAEGLI